MSLKTEWEGLWKQRDGVYSSYVLKKEDIPPYSKLIVRHNKYYEKDSTKPRFVFCFANGDSEKAITLKTEKEDFISMIEMLEKIKELEEQIDSMYTYEQVEQVKRGACIDGQNGYEPYDLLIEDYL